MDFPDFYFRLIRTPMLRRPVANVIYGSFSTKVPELQDEGWSDDPLAGAIGLGFRAAEGRNSGPRVAETRQGEGIVLGLT